MWQLIKDIIFAWRYKRAIRQADNLARQFGRKYIVLLMDGKLKVVPKQNIVHLVRTHRFRKGVTVQEIERRALYITR